MSLIDPQLVQRFVEAGWWGTRSMGDVVRENAESQPEATAYVAGEHRSTWSEYDAFADEIAVTLVGLGVPVSERIGVLLADGLAVHAALVGTGPGPGWSRWVSAAGLGTGNCSTCWN